MSRGKRGFTAPVSEAGTSGRNSGSGKSGATPRLKRTSLRSMPDLELAAWGRKVKKRDNYTCQWPNCGFCHNVPKPEGLPLDPHHKAPRSLRPDLRLNVDNGVTVCRPRHERIPDEDREEAIALGFLNLETYEKAMKEQK